MNVTGVTLTPDTAAPRARRALDTEGRRRRPGVLSGSVPTPWGDSPAHVRRPGRGSRQTCPSGAARGALGSPRRGPGGAWHRFCAAGGIAACEPRLADNCAASGSAQVEPQAVQPNSAPDNVESHAVQPMRPAGAGPRPARPAQRAFHAGPDGPEAPASPAPPPAFLPPAAPRARLEGGKNN